VSESGLRWRGIRWRIVWVPRDGEVHLSRASLVISEKRLALKLPRALQAAEVHLSFSQRVIPADQVVVPAGYIQRV